MLIRRSVLVLLAAVLTACAGAPPIPDAPQPPRPRQSAYPEHVLEAVKKRAEIQSNLSGSFAVVMEASSLEELLAIGKPTFVTHKGDLIWVGTGFGGKLTFMIDRVRRVQTDNGQEKWCILKPLEIGYRGKIGLRPSSNYSIPNRSMTPDRETTPLPCRKATKAMFSMKWVGSEDRPDRETSSILGYFTS